MGVCRGVGRTSAFDPGDRVVVRQTVPDAGEVPDREDAGQPVRVRGNPINDVGDTGRRDRLVDAGGVGDAGDEPGRLGEVPSGWFWCGQREPERTSVSRSATLRAVSRPQIVPFRVPSTGSFSLAGEISHRERGDLFIYLFIYGSVTGDRPQKSTVQIHAPLPIEISRQMNNLTAFSFAAMAVSRYDRAPHTPAPHSAVITAQIGPFPRKIDPFPQKPTCL